MWFGMLLNSMLLCMNHTRNMIPLETAGENFLLNFMESQCQAQQASMNLLIVWSAGSFPDKKPAKNATCLLKKNYTKCHNNATCSFMKVFISSYKT
jgi:hypothetical protein